MGLFKSGKFRAVGPLVSGAFSDGTFSNGMFWEWEWWDVLYSMCTVLLIAKMSFATWATWLGTLKSPSRTGLKVPGTQPQLTWQTPNCKIQGTFNTFSDILQVTFSETKKSIGYSNPEESGTFFGLHFLGTLKGHADSFHFLIRTSCGSIGSMCVAEKSTEPVGGWSGR
jgi:hypothetical protein